MGQATQIGAIQTEWNGLRFRSRLEARWAIVFEKLGLNWRYEAQGYQVGGVRYLPDFELRSDDDDFVYYVEVKGVLTELDCKKMAAICDFESPLPSMQFSHLRENSGLILLGDIPYFQHGQLVLHPMITHYKGLHLEYVALTNHKPRPVNTRNVLSEIYDCSPLEAVENDLSVWTTLPKILPVGERYHVGVTEAYAAGRSARFEHGEAA